MKDINLIQSLSLFNGATEETIEQLSCAVKINYYKNGTLLFDANQAKKYFLYVKDGWIKLFRETFEGVEVIVDIISSSSYSGELFLFDDASDSYSVQAISDVKLLLFSLDLLKNLITKDHHLSLNFLKYSYQKQQQLTFEMEHLSVQTAMQRIGCFFLRLCRFNTSDNIALQLPYDKAIIAARLGMRTETFSRALAKLCKDCDIKMEGDHIYINSKAILSQHICKFCSQTYPCKEITYYSC